MVLAAKMRWNLASGRNVLEALLQLRCGHHVCREGVHNEGKRGGGGVKSPIASTARYEKRIWSSQKIN